MAERYISEEEVERVLSEYHTDYTDKAGNPIFIARIGGRRLKVVIKNGSEPPFVITTGD